jgi:hypothetical protein
MCPCVATTRLGSGAGTYQVTPGCRRWLRPEPASERPLRRRAAAAVPAPPAPASSPGACSAPDPAAAARSGCSPPLAASPDAPRRSSTSTARRASMTRALPPCRGEVHQGCRHLARRPHAVPATRPLRRVIIKATTSAGSSSGAASAVTIHDRRHTPRLLSPEVPSPHLLVRATRPRERAAVRLSAAGASARRPTRATPSQC